MNEQIKHIVEKAGWSGFEALDERHQKLVKLVVKECAKVVDDKLDFENASGPDDWASGADVLAHFGVEE